MREKKIYFKNRVKCFYTEPEPFAKNRLIEEEENSEFQESNEINGDFQDFEDSEDQEEDLS